mgnify:CR=1 FL=1
MEFNWPLINDNVSKTDRQVLSDFILSGERLTNGPKVKEFEQAFLDRMERQHKSTLNELKAGQYTDAITAILEQCAKDLAGSYTA